MNIDELRKVIYLCEADASLKITKDVGIVTATITEQILHNIPYAPLALLEQSNNALVGFSTTLIELVQLWTAYVATKKPKQSLTYNALAAKFDEVAKIIESMKEGGL